jgi:hypothetical protein
MTNDKGQTALMVAESKRLNEMAAFLRFFESLGRQGYVSFISDFRNCISGGP